MTTLLSVDLTRHECTPIGIVQNTDCDFWGTFNDAANSERAKLHNLSLIIVQPTFPTHASHFQRCLTVASQLEKIRTMLHEYVGRRQPQHHVSPIIRTTHVASEVSLEWIDVAHSGTAELTFEKLGCLVDTLSQSLHEARFDEVDNQLAQANVHKMSLDAIVAISRITFPAKSNLAHWPEFVSRASDEIDLRGASRSLLQGLV